MNSVIESPMKFVTMNRLVPNYYIVTLYANRKIRVPRCAINMTKMKNRAVRVTNKVKIINAMSPYLNV